MIELTRDGDIGILRLSHGKASALDLELCEALEQALTRVEDSDARALVLTGSGSIFSAGVDLLRLVSGGADYVARFLPALDSALLRLFTFEKPLVAAINGHAIAGGAMIAGAADLRLLARGNASFGVPELAVGVPFPLIALEIARELVPAQHLGPALYQSRIWRGDECLAAGLVHEIVEPDQLLPRALERARSLAAIPAESFALTKRLRRLPALDTIDRHAARAREETLAVWKSPAVLAAIEAYVQKTLKR